MRDLNIFIRDNMARDKQLKCMFTVKVDFSDLLPEDNIEWKVKC